MTSIYTSIHKRYAIKCKPCNIKVNFMEFLSFDTSKTILIGNFKKMPLVQRALGLISKHRRERQCLSH